METNRPTITLPDGRTFGLVEGRKWTKVPRRMTNGQWTACWFVDEATNEVRLARSWNAPMPFNLTGERAREVLDIVARLREVA